MSTLPRVRVAFYGCGNFANRTRIPNLLQTHSVDIVAACDRNSQTAQETAARFKIPHVYSDAYEMLDTEAIDVLYSIVPAYVRTDVEVTAAQKGIHIFSEKPQALTMQVALSYQRCHSASRGHQHCWVSRTVSSDLSKSAPIFNGQAHRACRISEFRRFTPLNRGWTQNMVGRDGQIRRECP